MKANLKKTKRLVEAISNMRNTATALLGNVELAHKLIDRFTSDLDKLTDVIRKHNE